MNKTTLKAIKDGEVILGESKISCAVLNDEKRTRVLSQTEMVRALGRVPGGSKRGEAKLPRFISAKNITPYISDDLKKAILEPIDYETVKGRKALGIEAKYLPEICMVWLKAQDDGVLTEHQDETAKQANILIRGLAHVGIIALIDEATGYQYDREQLELQAVLKAFISEEILEWQKTFQLSFYREIFRLWGVPFTVENIRRKPLFIGKLTNELVYKNMPKGTFVLLKLKEKTPKTEGGNYKYKLHQSLTPEVGREALKKVIYSVEALASISDTKAQFLKLIEEKYGQKEIPFDDLDEINEIKKSAPPTSFDKALKGILSVPPPSPKKKDTPDEKES